MRTNAFGLPEQKVDTIKRKIHETTGRPAHTASPSLLQIQMPSEQQTMQQEALQELERQQQGGV